MPILNRDDILEAMKRGVIGIEPCDGINVTSVDVRIGRLLDGKTMKEVPLKREGYWHIGPHNFYLFETLETFYFAPGYTGRINSRSSWARYGVDSKDQTSGFFDNPFRHYKDKAICSIRTLGTSVKVRPGDALAQVQLLYDGIISLSDDQMRDAIKSGHLEVKRQGKRIDDLMRVNVTDETESLEKVEGNNLNTGGFTLTSDKFIEVYTGETIDPHEPSECFERKDASEDGVYIRADQFFLSASAEEIKITGPFVGWVQEHNGLFISSDYKGIGFGKGELHSFLQTNASAPKIDPHPYFEGQITFENLPRFNFTFRPGQRVTELFLYRLISAYAGEGSSRYKSQKGATVSQAPVEPYEQLEFKFD